MKKILLNIEPPSPIFGFWRFLKAQDIKIINSHNRHFITNMKNALNHIQK